jgi:hypothetical protein
MATARPMRGLGKAVKKLRLLAQQYPDRIVKAVYRRAELIMARSKAEFVPVDKGILMNSGHVTLERQGRIVRVVLAFGGAAKAYAIAVHEHLSEHSPPSWRAARRVTFHPAGRGPKYLERPLFEAVRTMAKDIAADLKVGAA